MGPACQTKNREIGGLAKAATVLSCDNLTVLTWDYNGEETVNKKTVRVVPVWIWINSLTQNQKETGGLNRFGYLPL